jgi:hypothetical protein
VDPKTPDFPLDTETVAFALGKCAVSSKSFSNEDHATSLRQMSSPLDENDRFAPFSSIRSSGQLIEAG